MTSRAHRRRRREDEQRILSEIPKRYRALAFQSDLGITCCPSCGKVVDFLGGRVGPHANEQLTGLCAGSGAPRGEA